MGKKRLSLEALIKDHRTNADQMAGDTNVATTVVTHVWLHSKHEKLNLHDHAGHKACFGSRSLPWIAIPVVAWLTGKTVAPLNARALS